MSKDVLKVTSSTVTCIEGEGATTELLARAMNKVISSSFSYQDQRACLLVTSLSLVEILDLLCRFRSTYNAVTMLMYLDSMHIRSVDRGSSLLDLLFSYDGVTDIFVDGMDACMLPEGSGMVMVSCIRRGINLTYTRGVLNRE